MEETIQNQPITPVQPTQIIEQPKSQFNIFLSIILSALITGGLIYWWQSRVTQSTVSQLQSQIDNLQNQLSQSVVPQSTTQPTTTTVPSTSQAPDKTASWQTHADYTTAYSIKYPQGWRKVDFGKGSIGVGPSEVGEDVKWAVNVYDSSATSIEQLISEIGKQFPDRKEKREEVVLWAGGAKIKAIKVTVTTPQISDWLSETIIFEQEGKIFSIGNGAIKDSNFELFYNSFTRLG